MPSAKDLTGQRFGRLVVRCLDPDPYISPSGVKFRRWICDCDCGSTVSVLQNALCSSKNGTKSCGCLQREKSRLQAHDMTGMRFGRLEVLSPTDLPKPEPNGTIRGWICRCDCGNVIVTSRKLLMDGLQSCGCLLKETAQKKINIDNVTGRYGGTIVSSIKPSRKLNSNNQSGVRGVCWKNSWKNNGYWVAFIGFQNKTIVLGRFSKKEDAIKARKLAEEKYFSPIIDEYEKDVSDKKE